QALINRDDLKGVASALRKAKRARISFEPSGESLDGMSLIIDTELTRYKWVSVNGSYPDYEKLIPTEFNTLASFDTVEAIKATNSLKALSNGKDYPIDLTIGDSKVVMANPDDKGQTELTADTNGEGKIRIDGSYLASVLKACGGMVEFKLTNAYSPMLFSQNGYQVVVMPMLTTEASEQSKKDREAKSEPTEQGEAEPITEVKTEPEASEPVAEQAEPTKPKKARHSRAKEPVTV
ncbi:unnamed protein product, partial [marine sediment metagenome]